MTQPDTSSQAIVVMTTMIASPVSAQAPNVAAAPVTISHAHISGVLITRTLIRGARGHTSSRRQGLTAQTEEPGILFLEIDGLAYPVLQQAMRGGSAPNL